MTRAGFLTLLPAVVFGAAALLFGIHELLIAAAVCGALVLLATAGALLRPPLQLDCSPSRRRIGAGTPLQVTVRARNKARWRSVPASDLTDESAEAPATVADLDPPDAGAVEHPQPATGGRSGRHSGSRPVLSLPPLAPGRSITDHYMLPTRGRGWRRIGPVHFEVGDPFGLTSHRYLATRGDKVLVWPRIDDLEGSTATIEEADDRRRRARITFGPDTDFHSLRRYEPGDDPHRIHWPASTRHRELLVRRFETVQQPDVVLYLETDGAVATPAVFERMVSAAAGLAVMAAGDAGSVRLLTPEGTEAVTGGNPAPLLDALALVSQSREPAPQHPTPVVGAARMILLAVVGDLSADHPGGLPQLPGHRVVLQFWQHEPPAGHRDIVSIGPDESTTRRWQEYLARRPGAVSGHQEPSPVPTAP